MRERKPVLLHGPMIALGSRSMIPFSVVSPLPQIALAGYVVMSAVTFIAFVLDKRAARRGALRTPERTLHFLELVGGFPGAFAAMAIVRHKNRKWSYFLVTCLIAGVHGAVWLLSWRA